MKKAFENWERFIDQIKDKKSECDHWNCPKCGRKLKNTNGVIPWASFRCEYCEMYYAESYIRGYEEGYKDGKTKYRSACTSP